MKNGGGGGGITIFHRKFLVPQYQKTLWVNTVEFQKKSGKEKIYEYHGGGCHVFQSEIFCLQCRNFLWVNPFVFQKVLGIEKFFA